MQLNSAGSGIDGAFMDLSWKRLDSCLRAGSGFVQVSKAF